MFDWSCFPLLWPYNKHKFECRSKEYVYLDRSVFHKGYVCLDKDTSKTFVSRHVTFDESCFPFQQTTSVSIGSSVTSSILLPSYVMSLPVSHSWVSQDSTTPTITSPLTSFASQSHSAISHTFSQHVGDCVFVTIVNLEQNVVIGTSNAHPMITRSKLGICRPKTFISIAVQVLMELRNYKEAIKCDIWLEAMKKEMAAL